MRVGIRKLNQYHLRKPIKQTDKPSHKQDQLRFKKKKKFVVFCIILCTNILYVKQQDLMGNFNLYELNLHDNVMMMETVVFLKSRVGP